MQINPNWTKWNLNNPGQDAEDNPFEKFLNAQIVAPAQTDADEQFDRDFGTEG